MTASEESADGAPAQDGADGPVNGAAMRRPAVGRHRLLWAAVAALVATAAVIVVLALRSGPDEFVVGPTGHPLGVGPTWEEIAVEVEPFAGRHYGDSELGLYELIDNIVFFRPYFARGRNIEEVSRTRDDQWNRMTYEAIGHERDRLEFEFDVESALLVAYRGLPTDLGKGGFLEGAYFGWLMECLAPAGFPDTVDDPESGAEVPIWQAEDEQLAAYVSETGFSRDEFYDLRYDCARRAATYPSLDPEVRDEMIGRMRRHYLEAVNEAVCYGSLVEVPVSAEGYEVPHYHLPPPAECDGGRHEAEFEGRDPKTFTRRELTQDSRARRELSVYRLFADVGVLRFLESYIIDLPRDVRFISFGDVASVLGVNGYLLDRGDHENEQRLEFENVILNAALYAPDSPGFPALANHVRDAFLTELHECGRAAGGPDMRLLEVTPQGDEYDPVLYFYAPASEHPYENYPYLAETDRDSSFGIVPGMSYFEHLEIRHACMLRAVAYPTLDPAARDRQLASQREHFAQAVLDAVDGTDPPLAVPPEYRDQIDELRRRRWQPVAPGVGSERNRTTAAPSPSKTP